MSSPARDLLRNRDYTVLWSGQIVSLLGSTISQITLPLLVLSLTGSPASAGLIDGLYGAPYPIFSVLAGTLVDRWDRKRVMMVCEAVNVLATGSIPLALWIGTPTMIQLALVALLSGTAFVFFNVAEIAALPNVVTKEQLPTATAQNQMTYSLGGLLGPPLGGFLYGVARALPFLADTISYAVSLLSLLAVRTPFQGERSAPETNLLESAWEGISWLWRQRTVRLVSLLTAGFNLLFGGYALLIIVLARQHHATPTLIGVVFAIAAGGSLIGAAIAPRLQRRLSIWQIVMSSLWIIALTYPLYIAAPNVLTIGLISAAQAILGPAYNVSVITYRLSLIPDELQGRVNSAARMLALGTLPIGAALTGALIQAAGTTATIWIITAGMAVLALVATLSDSIRHAPARIEPAA